MVNLTSSLQCRSLLLCALSLLAVPSAGFAQKPQPDLGQMSIEDLMSIQVTSASRKEQRTEDVAAAIFVITHDDIRRSGMTTVPDLLRLAPGVEVAQINSNKWAVSVRGFNGLYANKLLVLVDGRSLYNRLFSGVLWDAQDLMVDDIDHIEVIRGPGAAIWGANAVNGVINIVTRTASDTQGGLVRLDAGSSGQQGAFRYGGTRGTTPYRLYAQWTGREQSLIVPGTGANDASHSITTGFRSDWKTFMLEGGFTTGEARALWSNLEPLTVVGAPISNVISDGNGGHLLGRWTRPSAGGSSLQVQSFFDISSRHEPVGDYRRHAMDVDTQFHTVVAKRHDVVVGAGYRYVDEGFDGQTGISLIPVEDHSSLLTAFVQDEIALFSNRLALTFGTQVQYDSNAGGGVQPTARAMWKAGSSQRLWVATSRALRTPSLNDRGVLLVYPPVPSGAGLPLVVRVIGNPSAATETLVDGEVGYRYLVGTVASIDATGFVGRHEGLPTQEPGAPVVQFVPSPQILVTSQFGNLLAANTRGLEVAGHWSPAAIVRFDASYTAFHITPQLAATSLDPIAGQTDGSAPRTQWQFRSTYSPVTRATLAVAIFRVGPLAEFQVKGYTRADLNAQWRLTPAVSVMVIGANLLNAANAEFSGETSLLLATQIPRSVSVRVRWASR